MTFVGDLHAALDTPHRDDTSDAVHDLVGNALRRLDPSVEVQRTHYFTHTFVPDIVLSWNHAGLRRERHVHLRFSVTSGAFRQDLDVLGSDAPLFIGMTDRGDLDTPEWATNGATTNGSLVTRAEAINDLEEATRAETRAVAATGALVRVGHGVLDEQRAGQVSNEYVEALHSLGGIADALEVTKATVEAALTTINKYLPEDGQLDIERTLQAEWIRGGGDPYDFPSTTPWNPELLDIPALRRVLRSLLDSGAPVLPETWQRNAGFIKAEDLGAVLGSNLRGGTFNHMAHALMPNWTAKWVWAERLPSPPLEATYDWMIDGGILGIEANDLRTFFADDGRHFKDKNGGNPLPALSEAQQMLSQPGLMEVGLRGLREGIRYEPLNNAGDVFARIREILSAPDASSYRVQSVKASVPGTDSVADINLDRQVIELNGQSTPISTLARMATRFFSRASRPEGLDHFLATGELPAARATTDETGDRAA
jgi:hypothetical protein